MSISFQLSTSAPAVTANFSNANACAVLALLGLPQEPAGEVTPAQVPAGVERLMRLANLPRMRAPATHEGDTSVDGRCVAPAQTDAMVQRRLVELLGVFNAARRHGCGVTWG